MYRAAHSKRIATELGNCRVTINVISRAKNKSLHFHGVEIPVSHWKVKSSLTMHGITAHACDNWRKTTGQSYAVAWLPFEDKTRVGHLVVSSELQIVIRRGRSAQRLESGQKQNKRSRQLFDIALHQMCVCVCVCVCVCTCVYVLLSKCSRAGEKAGSNECAWRPTR
jgi:hypothetical protein